MADEAHGGARPRAGRPLGSKNATPSKAAIAQATFAALVIPELETYFYALHNIATNSENKPTERIIAIRELLDRAMGRAAQTVAVIDASADASESGHNASELLGLFETAPELPPISETVADIL